MRTIAASFPNRTSAEAAGWRVRERYRSASVRVADLALYTEDGIRDAGIIAATVSDDEGQAVRDMLEATGGSLVADYVSADTSVGAAAHPN